MSSSRATDAEWNRFREYIRQSWRWLERTSRDLVAAARDPKLSPSSGRWPVYVSRKESLALLQAQLREEMAEEEFAQIELRTLPEDLAQLPEHGLLYLPHPYVVPGGRFNEMYGWDSYFITVGLLGEGEIERARNMVENFLYQIEHYGKILNANRTYYLTRSQPPFLTRMILDVYHRTKDKKWLARTVPAIEASYRYWTEAPHLTPETGLSRYYDSGRGPAPEVVAAERDEQGRTHYDRVREYYRTHRVSDYDLALFYDAKNDRLTDLFYIADRSMRESGFDPSGRFGPFNAGILFYNPVCLNSLLYVMEKDGARILRELGRNREAQVWEDRARIRRQRVNKLLWDERAGLYFDYNFVTGRRRRYPFVTTFYPLWAGIATPRQAARVVANLSLFERPGGLQTSTTVTGNQWDAPYGWAPMQLLAVKGLRRYGYHKAANRISINFVSLVLKEFLEHGAIFEKYDVMRRESDVGAGIRFGYTSNEIGFGWTNATVVELLADLPHVEQPKVRELNGVGLRRSAVIPTVGQLQLSREDALNGQTRLGRQADGIPCPIFGTKDLHADHAVIADGPKPCNDLSQRENPSARQEPMLILKLRPRSVLGIIDVNDKDSVGGEHSQRCERGTADIKVKGVEDQTHCRMIHPLKNLPTVGERSDAAAGEAEKLKRYFHPIRRGALAEANENANGLFGDRLVGHIGRTRAGYGDDKGTLQLVGDVTELHEPVKEITLLVRRAKGDVFKRVDAVGRDAVHGEKLLQLTYGVAGKVIPQFCGPDFDHVESALVGRPNVRRQIGAHGRRSVECDAHDAPPKIARERREMTRKSPPTDERSRGSFIRGHFSSVGDSPFSIEARGS